MTRSETKKVTSPKRPMVAGNAVHVAVWKDNDEYMRYQDVFTNYSHEVFFDFSRPLRLLDAPGWGSQIKTSAAGDGFFVFTSDEKPY